MTETPTPGWTPPSYDDVLETYGLEMLMATGDLSLVNGELAMTKDGDFQMGDIVYNGLFRLVQAWRYNAPHLRFLFEMMNSMRVRRVSLDDKMNRVGEEKRARFDIKTYMQSDLAFTEAFHGVIDEQGAADFGFATYGGCLVMLLSGSLLRFKDDIDAAGDDWTKAEPLFNGCSFGQVIVAAANGFRHDDEWAKTRPSKPQQKVSQDILITALQGNRVPHERTPGRCAEVLEMLSRGGDFDRLTANMFAFAHDVACRRRAATKP
jgi:hypothetical protein